MRRLRSVSSAPPPHSPLLLLLPNQTAALITSVSAPSKGRSESQPDTIRMLSQLCSFGLEKKCKCGSFCKVSNMSHYFPCSTSRASHSMAFFFGFGTTRVALPTSPIIHRVNKNGFGWNKHPVSWLKPTGRIVHNTDSLMHFFIFNRSCCSGW